MKGIVIMMVIAKLVLHVEQIIALLVFLPMLIVAIKKVLVNTMNEELGFTRLKTCLE